MASSSSSSYNSPCAACKFLRRKCLPGCIFAPYFPPQEPQKFANVHKIFGASNVTKLLNELLPHQREDAVNSLAYEAEARVKDPVYGCVGAITFLQRQVEHLQKELDAANADLIRLACSDHHHMTPTAVPLSTASSFQQNGVMNSLLIQPSMRHVGRAEFGRRSSGFGAATGSGIDHNSLYQNSINTGFNMTNNAYAALPWSDSGGHGNQGSLGDHQGHISREWK